MQGLRERNQNIIKTHKRSEKEKVRSVVVPSHAAIHSRSSPNKVEEGSENIAKSERKARLDDEEMLFLAKRCLAEELMARPNVPSVLAEMSAASSSSQASAVPSLPPAAMATRVLARRNNAMFQLNRLGVGLVVLKFGWIWISCGGLVAADSLFCTSDIGVLVFRRLREHFWQVGSRLHQATRESIKLFTEEAE
jgi:hypothetical protein